MAEIRKHFASIGVKKIWYMNMKIKVHDFCRKRKHKTTAKTFQRDNRFMDLHRSINLSQGTLGQLFLSVIIFEN